jgi:carbonic anhydrase
MHPEQTAMNVTNWTRRRWLWTVGACSLVAVRAGTDDPKSPSRGQNPIPKQVEQALAALKAGNQRFADQKPIHAHQAADWRSQLTGGQNPFATILACSDSRVPPELVFDQGLGDLFVIRVAGNIIASDVVGSLAYALMHLKTSLVLVMGHEGCGAVTAALEAMDGKGAEPRFIANLLKHITPGLKNLDPKLSGDSRVNAAVESNVRASIKLLSAIPEGRAFLEDKNYRLAGAVYELGSGRVRFLD